MIAVIDYKAGNLTRSTKAPGLRRVYTDGSVSMEVAYAKYS
jgi:hypothetical protein